MHADGKSTLASVSKWNSGKVNWKLVQSSGFIKDRANVCKTEGWKSFVLARTQLLSDSLLPKSFLWFHYNNTKESYGTSRIVWTGLNKNKYRKTTRAKQCFFSKRTHWNLNLTDISSIWLAVRERRVAFTCFSLVNSALSRFLCKITVWQSLIFHISPATNINYNSGQNNLEQSKNCTILSLNRQKNYYPRSPPNQCWKN